MEQFLVTDVRTGEVIGATERLEGAARLAKRAQRQIADHPEGLYLTGPEGVRRRYPPELAGKGRWTFLIPCAEAECPEWIPGAGRLPAGERRCRECWRQSIREDPERLEQLAKVRTRTMFRRKEACGA